MTEPTTMPVGILGERFPGLRVRARGGAGPYRITGTNLLGWPSSLDYNVDPAAGTADWHGTVTRTGEFPVRMVVEDSAGARSELLLTFVFRPPAAPLSLVTEPGTMPVGILGERFPGLRVRARGGSGPYRITGTNLLGWPSSLDYNVDAAAGTADWHGTVTRTGEFPVRMVVEDSAGARSELLLTFVFRETPAGGPGEGILAVHDAGGLLLLDSPAPAHRDPNRGGPHNGLPLCVPCALRDELFEYLVDVERGNQPLAHYGPVPNTLSRAHSYRKAVSGSTRAARRAGP